MSSLAKWPPPYTLRRSRRARNISLQIDPLKGLELIIPYRANIHDALTFLECRRSWVEKHAHVLAKSVDDPTCRYDLPSAINLRAIEKTWNLRYHFLPKSKSIVLRNINDRLIFTGNIADFNACSPIMKRWIKRLAKDYFPQWLAKISNDVGLEYNKITIRGQKTLWGSCTPERNISLNYKLLFLPYEIVRYVFIHELCHTVHLNHSKSFWSLVRRHEPNYKHSERALKNADQFIPKWFLKT